MNIKKVLSLAIPIAFMISLFAGCSGMLDVPGSNRSATGDTPVAGAEVSFTGTTSTGTTVSFGAATDTETDDAALQYRVVTASTLAELDTVAEALALTGASIVRDWSTDTSSLDITGLTSDATYWYAVLVKDATGNVTLYDPRSVKLGDDITAVSDTYADNVFVDIPVTITTASLFLNDSNNIGPDDELRIIDVTKTSGSGDFTAPFTEADNEFTFTGTAAGTVVLTYTVQIGADTGTQTTATVTLNVVAENPPEAGSEVSFTGTTDSATTVSWGPGNDDETSTENLEYKVVTAQTLQALDTIAEANALTGTSIVQDWSTDSGSVDITGLNSGQTYWVAVLMRDGNGNMVLYDPRAVTIGESVTAMDVDWTKNVYVGIGANIPLVSLVLNDSNNVGDDIDLKIVSIDNVTNGSISPAFSEGDTDVTFVGAATGAATFTYTVQIGDDVATQSQATVTMTVAAAPLLLTAVDDSGSVVQKGETYIDAADLLANDVKDPARPAATLSIISVSNPVGGTVVLSGDGSTITFTSTDIAGNPASFEYTLSDSTDTDSGKVNMTATPLATIEALIFVKEDHVFEDIQTANPPPTVRNIFDKWGRFEGENEYWANGTDAESDSNASAAKTWTLIADEDENGFIDTDANIGTDNTTTTFNAPAGNDPYDVTVQGDIDGDGVIDARVMQRENVNGTNLLNGFVSPKKYENYTLEVTLWSADSSDDDIIGVVAAFIHDNGADGTAGTSDDRNYVLYLSRTLGGMAPNNGWGLMVADATDGRGTALVDISIDGTAGDWGGTQVGTPDNDPTNDQASRIKIVRNGDSITAWCTDWMTGTSNFSTPPVYNTDSKIEIDLSSTTNNISYKSGGTAATTSYDLTHYQGEQYYGYINYSQAMSTFLDIDFRGGLDPYTIILISQTDLTGNYYDSSEIWKYEGGEWVIKPAVSVQDELDYVRDVVNVQTGKTYTIRETSIEDITE